MLDMYLTKIERKTIFTRSLVYVLFMFVISDLTITGPFYFNFLPWIFILGIIASNKYVKPTMNLFITSFTVFLSSVVVEGKVNLNTILFTLITILLVILGTIVGKGINYLNQEKKLQIFLPKDKKIFMIIVIIVTTIISIIISDYVYSGPVKYVKSYIELNNQLKTKYSIKDYEIKNVSLNNKFAGKYIFDISIDKYKDYNFKFIKDKNNNFVDLNSNEKIKDLNLKIEDNFNQYIKENNPEKFNSKLNNTYEFMYSYKNSILIPDELVLYLSIDNYNEEYIDILVNLLNYNIKFLNEYFNQLKDNSTSKYIELNLSDKIIRIEEKDFNNINKEYILNALIVYEIDTI